MLMFPCSAHTHPHTHTHTHTHTGLVPTLSDNQNGSSQHQQLTTNHGAGAQSTPQNPYSPSNDLIVPSFSLSLPDELPMPELGGSLKRPASFDSTGMLMPPTKQQHTMQPYSMGGQSMPFQPKQEKPVGPTPHWHAMPTPAPAPRQAHQPRHSTPHFSQQEHALMAAGAELTREQRVARCAGVDLYTSLRCWLVY
jgi:hypothetical protein